MPGCSVKFCTNWNGNTRNTDIRYFSFPKDEEIVEKWIEACSNDNLNLKNARICSIHFTQDCFEKKPEHLIVPGDKNIFKLSKNAIPTEKLTSNGDQLRCRKKRKREGVNALRDLNQNDEPASKKINCSVKYVLQPLTSTTISTNQENKLLSNQLMLGQDTRCVTSDHLVKVMTSSPNYNGNDLSMTGSTQSNISSQLNDTKASILSEENADVMGSNAMDESSDLLQRNFDVVKLEKENSNLKIEKSNLKTENNCLKTENSHLKEENSNLKTEKSNLKTENNCLKTENSHLKEENSNLKSKNEDLNSENKILKQEVQKCNKKFRQQEKLVQKKVKDKVYEILKPVFTAGQINKLLHPTKSTIRWSPEDIAAAIALRSVSPKGYRYLRKKNMPLPGFSTLRKRAAAVDMSPGVLEAVLSIMKNKSNEASEIERLCVLSFDEVYISQHIEIDRKEEQKVGPHKTVQFGMVRGLFKRWKQPIFYQYDKALTANIVNETIQKLYDAGYTVVAVTTDLGSSNNAVWKSLNIGITEDENCFFAHPSNHDLKVFVFADPPHLLKLIRNNFIDSGFHYEEEFMDKQCLEELLVINKGDLRIPYKLEQKHLDAKGSDRQKVSLAAQVFSNTTAESIRWFGSNGFLSCENWEVCADFFTATNEWFDLFNSKTKYGKTEASCAYGVNLEKQNDVLNTMTSYMKIITVGVHENLPFQKGIILNNTSLQELLPYLKNQYDSNDFQIEYILTNRINQDVIENFFSYIRGMGAGHDKPSALQFRYRLRWYILGRHSSDMFIEQCNTEEDTDSTLIDGADAVDASKLKKKKARIALDNERMIEILGTLYDDEMVDFMNVEDFMIEPDIDGLPEIEFIREVVREEALLYIAGYVAYRFRSKHQNLGIPTRKLPPIIDPPHWLCHISKGSLIYPSNELIQTARILERIFNHFHKESLSNTNLIFQKVAVLVKQKINNAFIIPDEVLLCLVRTRTYIRLRELNKQRKEAYDKIRIAARSAKNQKFYT